MARSSATWRGIVSLLALALILSACGETPSATQGGSTPGATDGGATGDDVIIKAISGDTQTIDPRLNFQPRASEMVANLYDQLVTYETYEGEDGLIYADPTKPKGLLAERWEVSEDGRTWTWYLRQGVKFHSGREMTAEDLKWSFERNAKIQEGGWFDHIVTGLYADDENDIDDAIEIVDDYTVRMHFLRATPFVAQTFANAGVTVYDSELMKEQATEEDPWAAEYLKEHDAGTGPFMLESIEPGVQVVMKRFDDYFLGPAPASSVIFRVVPDASERVTLLESGNIHFAEEIDLNSAVRLADSENVQIQNFASLEQLSLMMSQVEGPTADPKVREAISYAIPYQEIVESVYFGYAGPGGGPLPVGIPLFDDNAPFYAHDLERARAALAESDYADGFETSLQFDSSRGEHEQAAILIQNALADLNIQVNIEQMAPAQFNEAFFAQELPFFLFQFGPWVADPVYHMVLFWEQGSYGNRISYANPDVDGLLAEAKELPDEERMREIFAEIQQLMLEDAPAVWIVQPDLVVAMSNEASGYVARPDQITRFYTISIDG